MSVCPNLRPPRARIVFAATAHSQALDALITQNVSFVVQERPTARDYPPVNRSAELKMVAAGRQIKARDPTIEVLMWGCPLPPPTHTHIHRPRWCIAEFRGMTFVVPPTF